MLIHHFQVLYEDHEEKNLKKISNKIFFIYFFLLLFGVALAVGEDT
jgi:hypothetical protein